MISRSKLLLNVYISFTLHFLLQRREIVIGHFKCFIFSLFLVSCHQRNENVFRRGDCPNLIKLPFNAQNLSPI